MLTLAVSPERAGYSAIPTAPVLSTKLDGGLPRLRTTHIGVSSPVTVQWSCDPVAYNYLLAFYRLTGYGSQPFQVLMLLDTADLQMYTVTIEPNTFRLISQAGLTYTMGATLNAAPIPQNATADAALVAAYESYGTSSSAIFTLLDTLINQTIPNAL